MAQLGLTVDELMADAIRRRNELDTFIRLLTNRLQGRDLVEDSPAQDKGQSGRQQHSV